jgi:hypothetical protein
MKLFLFHEELFHVKRATMSNFRLLFLRQHASHAFYHPVTNKQRGFENKGSVFNL